MPKVGKKTRQPKQVSGNGYCRKCQSTLSLEKFYEATNPMLDTNGRISICRECCNLLYKEYFSIYNNLERALDLTCRDLDVRFDSRILIQVQSHIEKLLSSGKKAEAVFGYYKSKLGSTGKNNEKFDSFRYKDSNNLNYNLEKRLIGEENKEVDEDLVLFWGKGFNIEDYIFLEIELSNWQKTHKCDNHAELILLKEICMKQLIIRNNRAENKDVSKDVKELQELFKTCSVDPAKANAIGSGQSVDRFGVWVKDIEALKPAEWWNKQEKYKDMDGFMPYINNYIVRPIKNFFTGVKDFFIDGKDLSFKDEDVKQDE